MRKKLKILICGEARHGKDTMAEYLRDNTDYTFRSSSDYVGRILYNTILKDKYGYESFEECFEDRVNHRDEWYELICEYNKLDRARVSKEILSEADIYVGMRDDLEFYASKELYDIKIWVDASKRLVNEGGGSNKLNAEMFDFIVSNNTTLEDFHQKINNIIPLLR